jgi:hypothetical protein
MKVDRVSMIGGILATAMTPAVVVGQAEAVDPRLMPLSTHFKVDDTDPEAHLPSEEERVKRPLDVGYLLMDLDERAEASRTSGNWNAALKYHRAGAALMPDRAISFALVCQDYEKLSMRKEALEACGTALSLPGAKLEHFVRFVQLVTTRPGEPDATEVTDALLAIEHVKKQPGGRLAGFELQCELSVRTHDKAALRECSQEIARAAPGTPRAISFAWALAMEDRDFARAESVLAEAAKGAIDKQALAKMERALAQAKDPQTAADALPGEPDDASSAGLSHPMVRWLIGLIALLLLGLGIGRRLVRGGSLSR